MQTRAWVFTGFFSTAVLIAATAYLLLDIYKGLPADFPYTSYIAVGMDVIGMLTCIALFITTLFDRRSNISTTYFMTMIALVCLLLFCDAEAWIVDGNPDRIKFAKMMNYYINGFVLMIIVSFWLYIKQSIIAKSRAMIVLSAMYYILLGAGMLLLLTNPWTDLVFTIDPDTGVYARGEGFVYSYIAPLLMLLLTMAVTKKYIQGRGRRLSLYVYSLLPLVCAIIQVLFPGIGMIYLAILFSTILIYGNFYVERGRELTEKQAKLVEQNITMMIAQIRPEFLSKSLESIAKLDGNPKETVDALKKFEKYMQGNLDTLSKKKAIPFKKEMEHVRTYVELEKLRFKNKLEVEYDLGGEDFQIPALTIQMLVENAIKHGVTIKEEGGKVIVRTRKTPTGHKITIVDDGVGFDVNKPITDDSRSHVGLTNVKQRVEEIVHGSFKVSSEIGMGTTITIFIPFQNKQ